MFWRAALPSTDPSIQNLKKVWDTLGSGVIFSSISLVTFSVCFIVTMWETIEKIYITRLILLKDYLKTCPGSVVSFYMFRKKAKAELWCKNRFVCVGAVPAGGDLVPETAYFRAGRGSEGDDSKTEEHQPHQGEHGALHSQPVWVFQYVKESSRVIIWAPFTHESTTTNTKQVALSAQAVRVSPSTPGPLFI